MSGDILKHIQNYSGPHPVVELDTGKQEAIIRGSGKLVEEPDIYRIFAFLPANAILQRAHTNLLEQAILALKGKILPTVEIMSLGSGFEADYGGCIVTIKVKDNTPKSHVPAEIADYLATLLEVALVRTGMFNPNYQLQTDAAVYPIVRLDQVIALGGLIISRDH